PRIYNETVEEGQAPAGEEAFGPVVRVGGAVPAAHGKKAEKAVKAEAQEEEKDVWAHPAKDEATEQTTFAEDLTIEPDEYELPDDEAPFDVPRSEEHTSELQSRFDLVCRPPPEKKK